MTQLTRANNPKRGQSKDNRFEARISSEDKELLKKAATLKGMKYTAFVLSVARQEAKRIIDKENVMRLNAKEYECLMDALESPAEKPDKTFLDALKFYRETVTSDASPGV